MAGYIGNKSSVTLVDGYNEAEADAEFVTKTGDSMTGNLSLGDNNKAIFGAGSDLQIYHDGSHSYIAEGGSATGSLRIRGENLLLEDNSGKDYLNAVADAQVELSHNGSKKFETTSDGVNVQGAITSQSPNSGVLLEEYAADAFGANFTMRKSRNATIGGQTAVASGDTLGNITFQGSDGDEFVSGASIQSFVDGTPGNNDMPGNLVFKTTPDGSSTLTERLRITSSGEILIGKTSAASSTVGAQIIAGGISQFGRSGAEALRLTRTTNDGNILEFQKNDTLVGFIGTVSDSLYIGTPYSNDSALRFSAGTIHPCNSDGSPRDNGINLGYSSGRFTSIFAVNGTIQTSDQTEKQDIASLTATEMLVAKRLSALFKTFRWKDSVAEKGDNARTHTGVIAQEVQAAFTTEGLDASKYGLFCSDTWWEHGVNVPAVEADEDNEIEAKDAYTRIDHYHVEAEAPEGSTSKTRLGIRYPELLSFVAAYNEQRFASIEARLTALEA